MSVTIHSNKWAYFKRDASKRTRGHERPGYQARHLLAAMVWPEERRVQRPKVERARVAVESVRIVGPDDLTARDQAVYECLLTYARKQDFNSERHRVDAAFVQDFLDVPGAAGVRRPSVDRVVECLDRLARTWVRYSFLDEAEGVRRRATLPLIIAETTERLADGSAYIEFGIPFALRRVMLDCHDYVMLDINAFPRFRCRYSPRLYQRLAVLARADGRIRRPWSIAPKDLAEILGWTAKGGFHCGALLRDCVNPAIEEINLNTRLSVTLTKVAGKGRGNPVKGLVLEITDTEVKHWREFKAAPLSRLQVHALKQPAAGQSPGELPSAKVVSRAITYVGTTAEELSAGWREALRRLKALPPHSVMDDGSDPAASDARAIRYTMDEYGTDEAFWTWAGIQVRDRAPDPVADMNADRPSYRMSVVQAQVAAPRTPAPEPRRVPPAPPVSRRASPGTPVAPAPAVDGAFDPAVSGRVLETSDDIPF